MAKKRKMKRTRKFLKSLKEGNIGDAIKVVTDAAGIEQCDDCKKRQHDWNFGKKNDPKYLNGEDFLVIKNYIENPPHAMMSAQQKPLLKVLEKAYNTKLKTTSCAQCWRTKIHPKIEELYTLNNG